MPPVGNKIGDGFPIILTFANNPTLALWWKTVKPPGMQGGEAVDDTSMYNVAYNTFNPRKLKKLTPVTSTAQWDEDQYNAYFDQINKNQLISVTFPSGRVIQFWGYLQNFDPNEMSEGNDTTAAVTIMPTMKNSAGAETALAVGTTTSTTATTTTSPPP
jgi:hypothetical protein